MALRNTRDVAPHLSDDSILLSLGTIDERDSRWRTALEHESVFVDILLLHLVDAVHVGRQRGAEEALRLVRVVQEADLQRDEAVRPQVDHLQRAAIVVLRSNHDRNTN